MLLSSALLLLGASAAPQSAADVTPKTSAPPPTAQDASTTTSTSALGGGTGPPPVLPSAPTIAQVSLPTIYPGGNLYRVVIHVPGVGLESLQFFRPTPTPTTDVPLLVHFHVAGGAGIEAQFFTTFIDEASARGWYFVAPDQAVPGIAQQYTYSCDEAQLRVQAVLKWALTNFPIDRERIYGYGFSMGGGDVVNYAARHLDPTRGTFAAIVNHTGTVCLQEEYRNGTQGSVIRDRLENLYGNPFSHRFDYVRASGYEIDWLNFSPTPVYLLGGDNLAENLAHVPTWGWYAIGDPATNLVNQVHQLDDLLAAMGAQNPPVEAVNYVPPAGAPVHSWSTLDETRICDWFAQQRLVVPDHGFLRFEDNVAAPGSGLRRYHDFRVSMASTPAFATLEFDLSTPTDIAFRNTDNVDTVSVDTLVADLDSLANPFRVEVSTSDGSPDQIVIENFFRVPTGMELDGNDVTQSQGVLWSYDAVGQSLTLSAPTGATHVWRVR